jgi:hypothetical protein
MIGRAGIKSILAEAAKCDIVWRTATERGRFVGARAHLERE